MSENEKAKGSIGTMNNYGGYVANKGCRKCVEASRIIEQQATEIKVLNYQLRDFERLEVLINDIRKADPTHRGEE